MKKTLPNLASLLVCLLSSALLAQTPAGGGRSRPAAASTTGQGGPIASEQGQALARRAIVAVDSQRSVSLRMRQHINMFGRQLVGTGVYQQLDEGEDRRLRLDLKVKVAEQWTSMLQVCNSRFLYIRRDLGGVSKLGRVDLRRIREAVAQSNATEGNLDISQQLDALRDHVLSVEDEMTRLNERVDFTEKLLEAPRVVPEVEES